MKLFKDMSFEEILDEIDLLMTLDDIRYFCKDKEQDENKELEKQNVIKEFISRFSHGTFTEKEVKQFLIDHKDFIDEKKLILLIIANYKNELFNLKMKIQAEENMSFSSENLAHLLSEERKQKARLNRVIKYAKGINSVISFYEDNRKKGIYELAILDSSEIIDEKKINVEKNRKRLTQIDSSFQDNVGDGKGLEHVIKYIMLSDLENIFPSAQFRENIVKLILDKVLLSEMNEIKLLQLGNDEKFDKYAEIIADKKYSEKLIKCTKEVLIQYAHYIDIDRLLLIAAYRVNDLLDENKIDPNLQMTVEKILQNILINFKNTNTKIKVIFLDKEQNYPVEYSLNDIKSCLGQFTENRYLTRKEIVEYRAKVLTNEITLLDIPKDYMDVLFSEEELDLLMTVNESNFIYLLKNYELDKEKIIHTIKVLGSCSTDILENLIIIQKLDDIDIIELYKSKIIHIDQIKEIVQFLDLSESVNSYELIEYYNNSIQKDATDEEKEMYDRYATLYKAVLVENRTKEQLEENSNKLIEQLMDNYEDQDYINAIEAHYKARVLTLDSILEWSGQDAITSLYEDKLIDLEDIKSIGLKLGFDYISNIYNQMVYSDEIDYDERIKYLETGFIGEDVVIDLYEKGLIMDEDLRYLGKKAVIREDIAEEIIESRDLDDRIKAARAKAIGWSDDRKIFDVNNLRKKQSEKGDTLYDLGTSSKKRTIIDPNLRQEYIEMLGLYRIEVECEEDSPFYHYEFYATPDESGAIGANSVIIAERYYDNKDNENRFATDNATYFFKYKDFLVLSNLRKQDMVKERENTVFRASHTITTQKRKGNWAESVLFNVLKIMMGSDLKDLNEKEKRKKLIETMSHMYTREECDRIFDLCKRIDSGESLYIVDRTNDRTTKKPNGPSFDDDDEGLR